MIVFDGKVYDIREDMGEDTTKAVDHYSSILNRLNEEHKKRVDEAKANLVHTLNFYSK